MGSRPRSQSARGDLDEGRRRRLELLDFYLGLPDDPFVIAVRAYSRAKLGGLDGDLERSERYYREAADGFARIDRPMMRAMCLGHGRRLRGARAATTEMRSTTWTRPSRPTTHSACADSTVRCWHGSGGRCFKTATPRAPSVAYNRALDLARRLSNTQVAFLALTGRGRVAPARRPQ